LAKKFTTGADNSQHSTNRSNAKSSANFKEVTDKVNVKMRASAFKAIIAANPNVKTWGELLRIIKVEMKKPAASRIAAFNTGILTEDTGSITRSNFFTGDNGEFHKTARITNWNGEADDKSGRADLSPMINPSKAPTYKKKELLKKHKKMKKI
tara:strand:- start:265 stop:723 length:459 start_codon:yes stop_codon:yes gene_type:complete